MIKLIQQQEQLDIHIEADLLNTSSDYFDLEALKSSIVMQLHRVFNRYVGKYKLHVSISITVLKSVSQCSPRKILFQVVDSIHHNNVADAVLKGMRIRLHKKVIQDILSNSNVRTIPHEVGHLFGWSHPHANATFESINKDANTLEQQLTEEERQCNLMSQTWYVQGANVPINEALQITEQQISLLLENDYFKQINNNYHLNYFLFWKKLAP